MKKFGLHKEERLSLKRDIESIFDKKNTNTELFYSYPLKVVGLVSENDLSQIIISVPKRKFKKSVDRNRLKRVIRECYRINKLLIKRPYKLGFIYISDKIEEYSIIEKAMLAIMSKL